MRNNLRGDDDKPSPETNQCTGASAPFQGFSAEAHRRQFAAIVEAIKSGSPPPVSREESLQSLAIVRGIYESAGHGKPVKIADLV